MTLHTSVRRRDPRRHARVTTRARILAVAILIPIGLLAACGEGGILEPAAPGSVTAVAGSSARTSVVVTPDYSAFDARTDFNNAGSIAQLYGFDEFSGDLVYPQATPWTAGGVTYTSSFNIVLAPGLGLGIPSNSISTDFGEPITGTFAASEAVTLFGADLMLIASKVPVSVVLQTNVRSYSFPNLDVPLAGLGKRFFGVALSRSGEYFTGFTFSYGGSTATGLLLDNVAIGHVGGPANTEPVASAGGPYAANEGSAVSLALTGTDADDDPLTFTWDLGDGTTGTGPTPPSSHVYGDNGSYQIVLTASDGRGGTHTAHAAVSISNVAPALAAFTLPTAPVALAAGGVTVDVSTTFADPGTLDVHTARLDCGTGVTVQSAAPNGTAGGACSFSSPGIYGVQLTVQDDDGGSDTRVASGQVVVYDAAAGWVTGGGWIDSPEGAYVADPSVAGKLTFGFVARYRTISATPSGNAEFRLNLAEFELRSTTLDWLVVQGTTAFLRGRGTVNGSGDFEFVVVAVDGMAGDAIRIRIWDHGTGAVVYDSQPGATADSGNPTPLSGGSIQIHSR